MTCRFFLVILSAVFFTWGGHQAHADTLTRPLKAQAVRAGTATAGITRPPKALPRFGLPFLFEPSAKKNAAAPTFFLRRSGYTLRVTKDGISALLVSAPKSAETAAENSDMIPRAEQKKPSLAQLDMKLVGASARARLRPLGQPATRANYYTGTSAAQWRRNVTLHDQVQIHGAYKGVDVILSGRDGRLSYQFAVSPRGKTDSIKFRFRGARSLRLNNKKRLVITLPDGGEIIHSAPITFEVINGKKRRLKSRFRLEGRNTVAFDVKGRRTGSTVIIDPVIDFGTYFGGVNDEGTEHGFHRSNAFTIPTFDMDVDGTGRILLGGSTLSVSNTSSNLNWDAFAARIDADNPSGARIDYISYFSNTVSVKGYGITSANKNQAYLCGDTQGTEFPVTSPGFDMRQMASSPQGFVVKLDFNGQLMKTTFVQAGHGTTLLDCAYEGATSAASGGLYFTGFSSSTDGKSDPSVHGLGPYEDFATANFSDAIIGKLTPNLTDMTYFSFLGGKFEDTGVAIAVKDSIAVITGLSESADIQLSDDPFSPHTLSPPASDTCGDYIHSWLCLDTFAARMDASGENFDFVTFLDVDRGNIGSGIDLDSNLDVYITGTRYFHALRYEAWGLKMFANGQGRPYITYFGGTKSRAYDIDVDRNNIAHIIGRTQSYNQAIGGAVGESLLGYEDAFYATLNPLGTLDYFTYLGGALDDRGFSVVDAGAGCVYLGLQTHSDPLNVPLPNAPQDHLAGKSDIAVLRHCMGGNRPPITILKELMTGMAEPETGVDFRITINNPGPWLPGTTTMRDPVPLPFDLETTSLEECDVSGQTVECTWDGLPSGETIIDIHSVNKLTCTLPGGIGFRENTATLRLPTGRELTSSFDVPYRECRSNVGEECRSGSDCSQGLLCAKQCEPVTKRGFFGQIINEGFLYGQAVCTQPSGVEGCDRVLQ